MNQDFFWNLFERSEASRIYYLASPYTHSEPLVREMRYLKIMQATSIFFNKNVFVFSPILYSHEMTKLYSMPSDADFWWNFNKAALDKCGHLIVYKMNGWDQSKGVAIEIEYARNKRYPIIYTDEFIVTENGMKI